MADRLGGPWPDHFVAVCGKVSAQSSQALPALLQWHKPWGQGGWSDLGDDARTLLGLDNVEMNLLQPWRTPFGSDITQLSAPEWILNGAASTDLSVQTSTRPELHLTLGAQNLVYSHLGLTNA